METLLLSEHSIRLFPDKFENDETIFFHGTSSHYSEDIEKYGLFPNHKPLTDYFYSIYEIADTVYTFTAGRDSEFSNFNKKVKETFEYFKDFTRLSFSAVSLAAADYSIGKMSGGQGLRHLEGLKKELMMIDSTLLENSIIQISNSQKHYFENLGSEIEKLKKKDGVVYAFKFDKKDIKHLSYETHGFHSVLLSFNHVPPSKIVAKMVVPNKTKFDKNLILESHNQTNILTQHNHTTTYIRDILAYNTNRNELFKNEEGT